MLAPYYGDFIVGDVIDFKFGTSVGGAPTSLLGSPVVSVYKSNSTTQSVAGVTLSVDFDSLTGLNHVRITTASDGTFYATAGDFQVVVTVGTVAGVSIAGTIVGSFSIGNRSVSAIKTKTDFLPSATAGSAGGLFIAGTNAATTITSGLTTTFTGSLTGSVASVSGAVGSVTGAVGSVTGNVGGNVVGSVGSVTGAVGSVTSGVTLGANAITAAALNADAVDEIIDETIGDGTLTVRQALRIIVAALAGEISGAGTDTVTVRNVADSANVIVATVDEDGNRLALTVTP